MARKQDTTRTSLELHFASELRRQLSAAIARKDALFFQNDVFSASRQQLQLKAKQVPELLKLALEIKSSYEASGLIFDGCDSSKYVTCCRSHCDVINHHRPGPLQILSILRSNLHDA